MRSERNRKYGTRYSLVSLDGITTYTGEPTLQDKFSDDDTEHILRNIFMEEMQTALRDWQPWAIDFLQLCLLKLAFRRCHNAIYRSGIDLEDIALDMVRIILSKIEYEASAKDEYDFYSGRICRQSGAGCCLRSCPPSF